MIAVSYIYITKNCGIATSRDDSDSELKAVQESCSMCDGEILARAIIFVSVPATRCERQVHDLCREIFLHLLLVVIIQDKTSRLAATWTIRGQGQVQWRCCEPATGHLIHNFNARGVGKRYPNAQNRQAMERRRSTRYIGFRYSVVRLCSLIRG